MILTLGFKSCLLSVIMLIHCLILENLTHPVSVNLIQLAQPLSLPVETQHTGSQTCGRTVSLSISLVFLTGNGVEAFPALTTCINRIYNRACRHHIFLHSSNKNDTHVGIQGQKHLSGQSSHLGFMFALTGIACFGFECQREFGEWKF